MLLWIYDEKYVHQYPLKQMSEEIDLDEIHFSLMKVRRGYLLNSSFYHLRIYIQVNQSTFFTLDSQVYNCLLLNDSDQYTSYHRFSFNNTIMIGSDDKNDIVFKDSMLSKFHLSCNQNTHEIQVFSSKPVTALNGVIVNDKAGFQNGDVLSFLTCRIIFIPNGIMINYWRNAKIKLQDYTNAIVVKKLSYPQEKIRYYAPDPPISSSFELKIKQFQTSNKTSEARPWILNVAPALLMSFASLFAGFLSAYQSYLNGRETISYLPMIILPGIMFLSTVLLNPFIHLYDKKMLKQRYQDEIKKYESYLDDLLLHFNDFKQSYLQQSEAQYFPVAKLVDHIYHATSQSQKNNHISFLVGYKKEVLDIHVESDNNSDPVIDEMISKKKEQMYSGEELEWIIDFKEYNNIAIVSGEEQITYFKQMLLQAVYYYDVPLCFYCGEEFIEDHPWILQIPNTYFQNARMISHKWDDILEWNYLLNRQLVCISVFKNIPSDYSGSSIQLLKEDSYVACDLLLDPSKNTFIDYKNAKEDVYSWDRDYQFNLQKCLYYLRNHKDNICKFNNDFFSIHQLEDLKDINIKENWKLHSSNQSLLAYIGIDQDGRKITLDLNEKKDGPHGLIAGMTGSGKSELIISFVLSLALRYSYEDVQFALIDFKGGGGSEVLAKLPHVTSKLTNLDTSNMKRALISFHNECIHRQLCIQKMNQLVTCNIMNLLDYRKNWKEEFQLPRLADLVIVIDEFAELRHQHPEFMDDLISVSRIGRSLGIHLILCTQKPTGVINDEIWSNCSFKICLKVQDKQDSKQMIHCEDAIYLKQPGSFYLLSERGLQKGISSYANAFRTITNTTVEVLNEKGDVSQSSNDYFRQEESEVNQIINKIYEESDQQTLKGLWLEPLKEDDCDNMESDVFACIDNYYERRYEKMHLFDEKRRNTVFVSNDHDEKKNCLNTLLYTCINYLDESSEIYLMSDEFDPDYKSLLKYYRNLIDVVSLTHLEKWNNLMQHIKSGTDCKKILIFQNLFFLDVNMQDDLHLLLEHASQYNLYIILFASNTASLKYRDLSFIQRRLVLLSEDSQDIQQLLQTSEKVIQKKNHFGLCKEKNVLEFCYLKTTIDQLIAKAQNNALHKGVEKPYRIPFMNDHITRKEYTGFDIPIGVSYSDYKWITCDPCESIYVVSLYKEEWIAYYRAMKIYCKCATIEDADHEDAQLLFLSLDEYRTLKEETRPVLYIGTSFSKQYTFHSKHKIVFENDAIFFKNYESEKARIL